MRGHSSLSFALDSEGAYVEDEDDERRWRQDDSEDSVRERGRVFSVATSEGGIEEEEGAVCDASCVLLMGTWGNGIFISV